MGKLNGLHTLSTAQLGEAAQIIWNEQNWKRASCILFNMSLYIISQPWHSNHSNAPLHQTANFRFRLQLFFVFRFWLFFSCPLLWIHIGWRLSGFQKKCLLFLDLFGNFLYFFCPFGGWKTNHSIKINQVWVLSSGHYLFETCQISASTAVLT